MLSQKAVQISLALIMIAILSSSLVLPVHAKALQKSKLSLTSSENPSLIGHAVKFTAKVSPSTATGKVTFVINGIEKDAVAINNGKAEFSANDLIVGTHYVTAKYSGDANLAPSTSKTLKQNVYPNLTGTWTGTRVIDYRIGGLWCKWTTNIEINLTQTDDFHARGTIASGSAPSNTAGNHTCQGFESSTKEVTFSGKITAKSFKANDIPTGIKIDGKFSPSFMKGSFPSTCEPKGCSKTDRFIAYR